MNIHEKLREYRLAAGFTQEQVAKKLFVNRNTYTQYESGKRKVDTETFFKIVDILGVKVTFKEWRTLEDKLRELQDAKKKWEDMRDELIEAIHNNDLEKVKEYIESGMDVETRDEDNNRIFLIACHWNRAEIAKYLLEMGAKYKAEWDYQWEDEWTPPLTEAAKSGDYEIVKMLLDYGFDPNDGLTYGDPPFYYAAANGHTKVMDLLIMYGANINIKYYNGGIINQVSDSRMIKFIKDNYYDLLDEENRRDLFFRLNPEQATNYKNYKTELEWGWEFAESENMKELESYIQGHIIFGKSLEEIVENLVKANQNDKAMLYPLAHFEIVQTQKINKKLKELVLEYIEEDISNGYGPYGDDSIIYEELKKYVLQTSINEKNS